MNKTTVEISEFIASKFAPCALWSIYPHEITALRIQNRMAENGIDFSECSKKQFRSAILRAYREIAN